MALTHFPLLQFYTSTLHCSQISQVVLSCHIVSCLCGFHTCWFTYMEHYSHSHFIGSHSYLNIKIHYKYPFHQEALPDSPDSHPHVTFRNVFFEFSLRSCQMKLIFSLILLLFFLMTSVLIQLSTISPCLELLQQSLDKY